MAVCGGGLVGIFEMLPKTLHVVFDIGRVMLSRIRLGQSPNLRQSRGNLSRIADVFYVLNRNYMCRLAVHSGHWLIAAALVEHRNPLKGFSIIYTLTVISLVT